MTHYTNLSILLVEDNEINQQVASELMTAAGINVEVANNGLIAVEKLLAVDPDHYGLVFMDVQMPEMDGHDATRLIRKDPRFQIIPIIAMTAHAMVEERERCLASGMNDHIAKPIDPEELFRTITAWCPAHVKQTASEKIATPAAIIADNVPENLVIEGIDVRDGLRRTMGNRDLYMQMLTRFRDDHVDAVDKIRQAFDMDRNYSLAERLAHTLKGVAALLGVTQVALLAGQLEERIHKGEQAKQMASLLLQLDTEMQAVHKAVCNVLPAVVSENFSAPDASVDKESVQVLIQRIASLLKEYDGEVIELLSDSEALLVTALGGAAHQRIARATRQFDFDGGLSALIEGSKAAGYTTL